MKRLISPLVVCLLLTPFVFGAEEPPVVQPPTVETTASDLVKAQTALEAQTDLAKKTAQLAIERAALTKEKDKVELDKIAAATAKTNAEAGKAQLNTLRAAAETEKAKLIITQAEIEAEKGALKVLRLEIDTEKVDLANKLAAVAEERTRLAAFAAELDGAKTPDGELAKAVVTGPKEAGAGTLVVLDASGSKAAAFMWLADGLAEDQYNIDSSGKRLYFATPCQVGEYKFVLSVALDNTVDALIHAVRVGEAPPGPDPPGPDPPGPDPPGPDPPPLTGFPKEVYDWVIELVPAEVRVEPAAAFHDNYMAIASQIVAGALSDLEKVDWEITKLNRGAVDTETRELWLPWFEKLKERFVALEASEDLTTVEHASTLFLDIAKGLKEIK